MHRAVALLLLALPALALGAQYPAADTVPVPVFLTVSGGISKGSHQGGVNWALLRVMRHSSDAAFRARHGLGPRAFTLGGMTGASAGNINAVLSAFEWCRAEDEPDPRESLFWRIWIPTGFSNMLNVSDIRAGPSQDDGIFDRTFFDSTHYKALAAFAGGSSATLGDCAVPIGITVTRRLADTARVFDGVYVPITRYATTFTVGTRRENGPPARALRFTHFAPDSQIAHFGQRIWLESDNGDLGVDRVYDIVTASSAFPLAFGPQELRYRRDPMCTSTECVVEASLFFDGGVFDNNPVDLTVGIRRRVVSEEGRSMTIYIDPDDLRRSAATDPTKPLKMGASGVLQTTGQMINAGRAAELYSVAKAVDLHPESFNMRAHPLLRTNRQFVIAGSEFASFGAFLGRPLRVFDFHVGIYDGLVFVAEQVVRAAQGTVPTADSVAERTRRLIEDESVIAFEDDRRILRQLWAAEFAKSRDNANHGRSRDVPDPSLERRVLDALVAGSLKATTDTAGAPCRPVGLLGELYCESDLPQFVEAVRASNLTTDLQNADNARYELEQQQVKAATLRAVDTVNFIDEDFARFIDAPQQRLYILANRLVARLYYNERRNGSQAWATAVSAAGLYLNQAYLSEPRSFFGTRDAWGLFDPSTIPRSISGAKCLRCWLPYRFTTFPGLSGVELEYRPTLRLPNKVGVFATYTPFIWHLPTNSAAVAPDYDPTGRDPARRYWSVGLGTVWQRGDPLLTAVEFGWRGYRPYRRSLVHLEDGNVWALDLSAQLLAGRLQAGIRHFPDNEGRADTFEGRRWGGPTTLNGGLPYAFYVSLPDVPGLLYWFLPR